MVINTILTFPCVSELSRLKDEEISAAAIKAQFEKQLLTERTLKTQVGVINYKEDFEIFVVSLCRLTGGIIECISICEPSQFPDFCPVASR